MKITIVYPENSNRLQKISDIMKEEFVSDNFEIIIHPVGDETVALQKLAGSLLTDLIIIGVEPISWSGDFSTNILTFLQESTLFEGRRIAIFVLKKFLGTQKALSGLMKVVEEKGGFLFDFETLGNNKDAREYACRLKSIKKTPGS